jgi:hypothetical protein
MSRLLWRTARVKRPCAVPWLVIGNRPLGLRQSRLYPPGLSGLGNADLSTGPGVGWSRSERASPAATSGRFHFCAWPHW